jgi:hypothetical protein
MPCQAGLPLSFKAEAAEPSSTVPAMANEDRPVIQLTGEQNRIVHATWSRSKKNVIVTVAGDEHWSDYQQTLLTPTQAEQLAHFLLAGADGP